MGPLLLHYRYAKYRERNKNVTVIMSHRGFGFQQLTKTAVKILAKYVFDKYTLL